MHTGFKLLVAVSAIGGVAGGGIALNKFFSTEDIQSKLEVNGLKKISDKNDSIWDKIFQSYKTVATEGSKFRFNGETVDNKEKLQAKCEEVFKKKISEDNETNNYYSKATRWCTVPTSVSQELEKTHTILSTDEKNDELDKDKWDDKIKKYTKQDNKDTISTLTWEKAPVTEVKPQDRKKIKVECKKLNDKQSFEEGYVDAKNKSKSWCAIEKDSNKVI